METGYLTPFLDMLKQGQLDRDIRLMAAQGELGLRPDEQRGVLDFLASDADSGRGKGRERGYRGGGRP